MIAFIGVGALLLAANFIVEENVLVERITRITRIAPAPAAAIPPAVIEAPHVIIAQRRVVTSEPLVAVLDRFGRAIQDRVATKFTSTGHEHGRRVSGAHGLEM